MPLLAEQGSPDRWACAACCRLSEQPPAPACTQPALAAGHGAGLAGAAGQGGRVRGDGGGPAPAAAHRAVGGGPRVSAAGPLGAGRLGQLTASWAAPLQPACWPALMPLPRCTRPLQVRPGHAPVQPPGGPGPAGAAARGAVPHAPRHRRLPLGPLLRRPRAVGRQRRRPAARAGEWWRGRGPCKLGACSGGCVGLPSLASALGTRPPRLGLPLTGCLSAPLWRRACPGPPPTAPCCLWM